MFNCVEKPEVQEARLSELGLNINDKMLTYNELDKLYSSSGLTYSIETPNIYPVNNFQQRENTITNKITDYIGLTESKIIKDQDEIKYRQKIGPFITEISEDGKVENKIGASSGFVSTEIGKNSFQLCGHIPKTGLEACYNSKTTTYKSLSNTTHEVNIGKKNIASVGWRF